VIPTSTKPFICLFFTSQNPCHITPIQPALVILSVYIHICVRVSVHFRSTSNSFCFVFCLIMWGFHVRFLSRSTVITIAACSPADSSLPPLPTMFLLPERRVYLCYTRFMLGYPRMRSCYHTGPTPQLLNVQWRAIQKVTTLRCFSEHFSSSVVQVAAMSFAE
jgi:hypothetical protein